MQRANLRMLRGFSLRRREMVRRIASPLGSGQHPIAGSDSDLLPLATPGTAWSHSARAPLPAAGQATGAQGDLGVARPEEARWHAHSVPV